MTYTFTPKLETADFSETLVITIQETLNLWHPLFRKNLRNFIRLFRSGFRFSRAMSCGMFRGETP